MRPYGVETVEKGPELRLGPLDKKAHCLPTQQHQRLIVVTLGQKGAQSTFRRLTGPFSTVSGVWRMVRILGGPTDGNPRTWPRPDCADTSVGSDEHADTLRTGFAAQTRARARPGDADQANGGVLGRQPTEHRPSSRDALLVAEINERHLHQDRASGARDNRPGLKACLEAACEEGACAATERLLDDAPGLDGLVMPVDAFATGAMRVPRGRGLAVPGRVRVATRHDGPRPRGAPGPDGGGPAARHGWRGSASTASWPRSRAREVPRSCSRRRRASCPCPAPPRGSRRTPSPGGRRAAAPGRRDRRRPGPAPRA